MELVSGQPNVELRRGADGAPIVVLGFPYDAQIVAVVRTIPHRRVSLADPEARPIRNGKPQHPTQFG